MMLMLKVQVLGHKRGNIGELQKQVYIVVSTFIFVNIAAYAKEIVWKAVLHESRRLELEFGSVLEATGRKNPINMNLPRFFVLDICE